MGYWTGQLFSQIQELQYVDLLGRSLLHVGDRFGLLPMKHPPVEAPYKTPYRYIAAPAQEDAKPCIRVSSDGSSKDYVGGGGVAILPPCGRLPEDVVLVSIPIAGRCTNIRAELIAAAYALRVCVRNFVGTSQDTE